jgi:FkbM family methyltransferase
LIHKAPRAETGLFEPAIFRPEHEDEKRLEFFGDDIGYFVEVGAHDPIGLSQTYVLEQRGWNGILVEPLPDYAQRLRSARKARVFECACAAPAEAGKTLPFYVASGLSSLRAELPTIGVKPNAVIEVKVRTLDDILTEAGAPAPLDLVSIDVEGLEIDVLEGFDLARWRPRLLILEDRAIDFTLHRYVRANGYRWIKRFALNNWYVPEESPATVSAFGRLQYIRKFYLGMPLRRQRQNKKRARARSA